MYVRIQTVHDPAVDVLQDLAPADVSGKLRDGERPEMSADKSAHGRFPHAFCQIQRSGGGGKDVHLFLQPLIGIYQSFERQANVGEALGLINDDGVNSAENGRDILG